MIEEIKREVEVRMGKTIESLHNELTKIRTGRANPSLLDHINVDYYDNPTPINQLANISASDGRTLLISPWEKSLIPAIEKAILQSDLGLNPTNSGTALRVPMPPLTEERRKEMIRIVRGEAEQGRIAIRNIRRDANHQLKELIKIKEISEDEERRANEIVQKLTDKYIANVDQLLVEKEKDLMEV